MTTIMPQPPVINSIDDAMNALENISLQAIIHLASGIGLAVKFTEQVPGYNELLEYSRHDVNVLNRCFSRLQELSNMTFDTEYVNPYDLSLFLYARILVTRGREIRQPGVVNQVKQIIDETNNTFWSRVYIHEVATGRIDH